MKKLFFLGTVLCCVFRLCGDSMEWSGTRLRAWNPVDGLTVSGETEEGVLLKQTRPGGSLEYTGDIPAASGYNVLELEFRARRLPERNNGKLLFAAPGKSYSRQNCVWFEHMKVSEEFRMLQIPLNHAWEQCGTIGKMRLGIPNQAPAEVELRTIRLRTLKEILPVDGSVIWAGREDFRNWRAADGAEASLDEDGVLHFRQTRPGGSLEYCGGTLINSRLAVLEIEYRATNVPEKNNGKLLFAAPGESFSAKNCVWFENLRPSGEFQTLRIPLNSPSGTFGKIPKIGRMRLGIPNQAPAEVEIRSIRFLGERSFRLPESAHHLFRLPECGLLDIRLPDRKYDVYLQSRSADASPSLKISPPLEKRSGMKTIINGAYHYLPLGCCSGGRMQVEGRPDGRLTGLMFCEGVPGGIPEEPFFPPVKGMITSSPRKADLPEAYFSGYMIRAPQDIPSVLAQGRNQFAFTREFLVPPGIRKAQVQIAADDRFLLTLNGKKILEFHEPDGWRKTQRADITELLRPGKNHFDGIYQNIGGPGGLIMEVEWIDSRGEYHAFGSDRCFRFAAKEKNDWRTVSADVNFQPAVLQSAPPHPPWTTQLNFTRLALRPAEKTANHRLRTGKNGMFWEFSCSADAPEGTPVTLLLSNAHTGAAIRKRILKIARSNHTDGVFRFPVELPRFHPSCRLKLSCRSGVINWEDPEYEFDFTNSRQPGKKPDLRVINGKLMLDGKAVYPVIGNSHTNFEAANFHLAKVPFRTVWTTFWNGVNQYDFSDLDAKMEAVLRLDDTVKIFIHAAVDAPEAWGKAFPDERVCYADGTQPHLPGGLASFASHRYRMDGAGALEQLAKHINMSPYADKIAGYLIAAGYTAEWQHWDSHRGNPPGAMLDYSPAAKAEFAKYLSVHAPELDRTLPSPEERRNASKGILLHPELARKVILHSHFHSKIVADTIAFMVKRLRRAVGDGKLLAVYYGYPFEYGNMGFKLHNAGHNALADVLKIRELDALLSPPSYGVRNLGESGEDMKPFASIRLAGKLSVIDDDTRTELIGRSVGFFQTCNPQQTRSILRRNLGRTLCRMEPLCLYPLTTGNEFSSPEIIRDIRQFRQAADFALKKAVRPAAEIAVVISERGNCATAYCNCFDQGQPPIQEYNGDGTIRIRPRMTQKLTGNLLYYQRNSISRIGAPADYLLAETLSEPENLPYRLYIFLNCFAPDEAFLKVVEKIRRKGAKMLFCYAPGGLSPEGAEFAGFRLKPIDSPPLPAITVSDRAHPAAVTLVADVPPGEGRIFPLFTPQSDLNVRILGTYPDGHAALAVNGNSVFCGVPNLTPDLLRSLARWSGVHIYSESDDILYANDSFLSFHAVTGGIKRIRLKKKADVVDCFSGEVLARNTCKIEFHAALHESRLFFCGNADEFPRSDCLGIGD